MSRFDFADIIDLINRTCVARGFRLTPKQFGDTETVERFLKDVTSKWVVREMRRARHRNTQHGWTDSDLNDVNALSGAVVYCDVVVTERLWAHHLNKEGLADLRGNHSDLICGSRRHRVRAIAAAHEAVGTYADAMINSPSTSEYQRIRRRRNKAEYDDITIGSADLTADLAHAAAIIQAVRAAL